MRFLSFFGRWKRIKKRKLVLANSVSCLSSCPHYKLRFFESLSLSWSVFIIGSFCSAISLHQGLAEPCCVSVGVGWRWWFIVLWLGSSEATCKLAEGALSPTVPPLMKELSSTDLSVGSQGASLSLSSAWDPQPVPHPLNQLQPSAPFLSNLERRMMWGSWQRPHKPNI